MENRRRKEFSLLAPCTWVIVCNQLTAPGLQPCCPHTPCLRCVPGSQAIRVILGVWALGTQLSAYPELLKDSQGVSQSDSGFTGPPNVFVSQRPGYWKRHSETEPRTEFSGRRSDRGYQWQGGGPACGLLNYTCAVWGQVF